jgi:hypothetical protein
MLEKFVRLQSHVMLAFQDKFAARNKFGAPEITALLERFGAEKSF